MFGLQMPFVDSSLKPAEADFVIADSLCPMESNLSAEAIDLNGDTLDGAIENGDGGNQIEALGA